ncbi:MAG: hypothetical protein Fur0022_35930 [Anaerolineales bacterium]
MRLLFVADGRSPIALNWIQHFAITGHEVHLASTYPCKPDLPLASLTIIPVAFSQATGENDSSTDKRQNSLIRRLTTPGIRTALRQWLGPLTVPQAGRRLRALTQSLQPDLVHAMRIPYEGMIAAQAKIPGVPLLVSIWGNDFTLHARSTPVMAWLTHQTLRQADAIHTDCYRDLRLASKWSFSTTKPSLTVPGNGGIDLKLFYPPPQPLNSELSSKDAAPKVINPRGFRAYVRNDTFFHAIPLVLAKHPQIRFLLPTMAEDPHAVPYQAWLRANKADHAVEFLPHLSRPELAKLFREAVLAVSPSEHDGTPNTLLEAMACGCLPIAGDIEAVREWITHEDNGLLFDPADPQALADAILRGLKHGELRERASKKNARLVADRAEYYISMAKVERFYARL